jgi:hypothetical protein
MGQAKVRKMNGTYGRESPQETSRWMQLPNTEELRNLLISNISTHDRKSTSYHESAHAIFFESAGLAVKFVTALPFYDGQYGNGWVRGVAKPVDDVIDLSKLCGYIEGILAGDLAQSKAGLVHADKTTSDQRQLERLTAQINLQHGTVFTADQTYFEFAPQVKRKLDDPLMWSAIEGLASRLQESEVVQGGEVREIVARSSPVVAKVA